MSQRSYRTLCTISNGGVILSPSRAVFSHYCYLFSALHITQFSSIQFMLGRSSLKVTQCIFLLAPFECEWFKLVWPNWSCEAKILLILDILYTSSLFSHILTDEYCTVYLMQNDPWQSSLVEMVLSWLWFDVAYGIFFQITLCYWWALTRTWKVYIIDVKEMGFWLCEYLNQWST